MQNTEMQNMEVRNHGNPMNPKNHGSDHLKDSDLTSKIIKSAMIVHSTLGNGFQEII